MAETSDRIMKFVGAARQEKGAEASKALGSLFYDKAAEKLDDFSKEIEFGTDSFAPPEGGLEDQEVTDALAGDEDEASESDDSEADEQDNEVDSPEEEASEEEPEEEPEEENGEETERDSSGSE
jgi:hypothetical protein